MECSICDRPIGAAGWEEVFARNGLVRHGTCNELNACNEDINHHKKQLDTKCTVCDEIISDYCWRPMFCDGATMMHIECATCEFGCSPGPLQKNAFGRFERLSAIVGHVVHLSCLKCSHCYRGNWSSKNAIDINGKLYHTDRSCIPCSECSMRGALVKTFDGKWVHPHCRKCAKCDEPLGVCPKNFDIPDGTVNVYHEHCAPCSKPGCKVTNESIFYDGPNDCYHASCFPCGICGQSRPQGKRDSDRISGRSVLGYDKKFCHSDCIPCYKCKMAVKGRHVKWDQNRGYLHHRCPKAGY